MTCSRWNVFPAEGLASPRQQRDTRLSDAGCNQSMKPRQQRCLDMHFAFPKNLGVASSDKSRRATIGAASESVIHGTGFHGLHIALAHAAAEAQAH